LKLLPVEHVANSTSRNGQESTSGKAVKESCYQHRLDILSHSRGDDPDQEEAE